MSYPSLPCFSCCVYLVDPLYFFVLPSNRLPWLSYTACLVDHQFVIPHNKKKAQWKRAIKFKELNSKMIIFFFFPSDSAVQLSFNSQYNFCWLKKNNNNKIKTERGNQCRTVAAHGSQYPIFIIIKQACAGWGGISGRRAATKRNVLP